MHGAAVARIAVPLGLVSRRQSCDGSDTRSWLLLR